MDIIVTDYESTTSNKGNPFDLTNRAILLAYKIKNQETKADENISRAIAEIEEASRTHTLFVFFNAKFDLHWHRRHDFLPGGLVWCCQLAEFYLGGQRHPFPSLDDTAKRYELGGKLEVNFDEVIPIEYLKEYAIKDVDLTYLVFLKQLERFQKNPKLYALFKIACQDLVILEEMEWNGLKYDPVVCDSRAQALRAEMAQIDQELQNVYPGLDINFGSPDQLSVFLYGGVITTISKEPVGLYMSGLKKGEIHYKNVETEHQLPRLIEPLPRSELAKIGYYSTDEGTLRKLKGKAAKKYIPLFLKRAKLKKLIGTYYEGIPKLAKQMNWEPEYVHGQFNQVVAATGRLSSSRPNMQNFSGEMEDVFITRF